MRRNLVNLLSRLSRERPPLEASLATREQCVFCGFTLAESHTYQRFKVCPQCRFHYTVTARERIQQLADPGTFKESHRSLVSLDPLAFSARASYRRRLIQDQRRTGLTEAAVMGRATLGGVPVAMVVLDFGFMGGTMGSVVGEKVAAAFEMAVKKRVPLVAVVTSGGARLQEGVLSLMQMAKTAMAATRLHQEGLPYVCVIANPTSGQVYASFANLADIVIGEPGALMGFAPLRTTEEASAHPLPPGAHTAESHLAHGSLDFICDREQLRETLSTLLDLLRPKYTLIPRGKRQMVEEPEEVTARGAWDRVELARHAQRPTTLDYIERMMSNYVELHGDRTSGDDLAVVCGLGTLGGQGIVFVGHDRRRGDGRPLPEGFRKAQRAMHLAAKFGLPLITFIDTPGADASLESEERGIGHAIASTLATMAQVPTPTIAAIIGEGGSEAALAFSLADRILMLENAFLAPMSPEAAASLLFRDQSRAQEVAESLHLTAQDCHELEIVDAVVPEPEEGAHAKPAEAARHLERALLRHLALLQQLGTKRLLKKRYKKFRRMGEYSSHFKVAVAKEVDQLQGYVAERIRRVRARQGDGQEEEEEEATP